MSTNNMVFLKSHILVERLRNAASAAGKEPNHFASDLISEALDLRLTHQQKSLIDGILDRLEYYADHGTLPPEDQETEELDQDVAELRRRSGLPETPAPVVEHSKGLLDPLDYNALRRAALELVREHAAIRNAVERVARAVERIAAKGDK